MTRLNRVSLLSVVVLFASMGCSSGGPDGAGGDGGAGASAGAGGTAGAGGVGGAGVVTRGAMETCQTWCRNETNGPSCCFEVQFPPPFDFFDESDCRRDCYDICEETVAEMACLEEYVAVRECQIQLACDDFFDECQALDGRLVGCPLRAEAEESGLCEVAAAACSITEAECLSTFIEAGSPDCALGWEEYVSCIENGFSTCEECVDFTQPSDQECNWPSGAGEDIPFEPQSCDTFTLRPAGCGEPCTGGSDTECTDFTYCEAEVCESNCITSTDCARGEACTDRGRCFPTIDGDPLECSFFDDPPSGCGASCEEEACPAGTFCTFADICDAECVSDEQCDIGEHCGDLGRCVLTECSDGRSLDGTFTSDRKSLTCNVLGIFDAVLEAELTAKPTAPIQSGSNTYDVQLALSIDADTVNFLAMVGAQELTFIEVTGTVAPTTGTTAPSSVEFQNTPLPCEESLTAGIPVEVILPIGPATWDLDDGTTQELTLEDIDATVEALGLEISFTTGPGGTCVWDVSPPKVIFSLP